MGIMSGDVGVKNYIITRCPKQREFEIVERKGIGHPDTMADALAEDFSRSFSNYTNEAFGAILHHNFDKVGLLGGASKVTFGKGKLIKPIRVLINGRASISFGNTVIPVKKILEERTFSFFSEKIPQLNFQKDIKILYNISTSSSPGKIAGLGLSEEQVREYMFKPRGLFDLKELSYLGGNDTSIGCSYAPLSFCESLVLEIERKLSGEFRKKKPWVGSDIKILAIRNKNKIELTICVPEIASFVSGLNQYIENLEIIKKEIFSIKKSLINSHTYDLSIFVNTKDNYKTGNLYLTATGSAIESGDEGLVGRGNRINGLITSCRPMSIEGICGKNPVYHVGKMYNIIAQKIAKEIFDKTKKYVEAYIVSQNGRLLSEPWAIIINSAGKPLKLEITKEVITKELDEIPNLTKKLLKGEIQLY
jgi:S-adenosylmethionine synthetase